MEKRISLFKIDHELAIEIIRTLYSYDRCHLEHANGKTEVCVSYCLQAKYAEDFWISQEFTKHDLSCHFSASKLWETMTNRWERMSEEQKNTIIKAYDAIVDAEAEVHYKTLKWLYADKED